MTDPRDSGLKVTGEVNAEEERISIEILGDGAEAVHEIGRITGNRRPDEVVSDALNTYLWLLHQQTSGSVVASTHPEREALEVMNLVEDSVAVRAYFDKLGW